MRCYTWSNDDLAIFNLLYNWLLQVESSRNMYNSSIFGSASWQLKVSNTAKFERSSLKFFTYSPEYFVFCTIMLQSSSRSALLSLGLGRRAASSIALKYSNAVYSAALAKSPQLLNKVQTELNTISISIKDTPELNTFVHNPTLSAKDRATGLLALYNRVEGYGARKETISDVTKNMFAILSENGRLGEVQGVIEGFNELCTKYKGELTVIITSATPLPRDVQTKLESTLKQSQAAQQAKTIKVTNKVRYGSFSFFLALVDVLVCLRWTPPCWEESSLTLVTRLLTSAYHRPSTNWTTCCSVSLLKSCFLCHGSHYCTSRIRLIRGCKY